MRGFLLVIAIVGLLFNLDAKAETVEIPLTSFLGPYSQNGVETRIDSIQIDPPPDIIYGVWIRLSGDFIEGVIFCDPDSFAWHSEFTALFNADDNGYWSAGINSMSVSHFETTIQFRPNLDADWQFLLDGNALLEFSHSPFDINPLCDGIRGPSGIIAGATLIVECDYAIRSDRSTWGMVKSRYE